MSHERGKGKRLLVEGGQWSGACRLCDGGGFADDAAVGERRGGERDFEGFGRVARIAVRGGQQICVGGGSGIFTGSAAEGRLKGNALAGVIDDYELSFEAGSGCGGGSW
jgi:hypothetical protein